MYGSNSTHTLCEDKCITCPIYHDPFVVTVSCCTLLDLLIPTTSMHVLVILSFYGFNWKACLVKLHNVVMNEAWPSSHIYKISFAAAVEGQRRSRAILMQLHRKCTLRARLHSTAFIHCLVHGYCLAASQMEKCNSNFC